jgi:hypothetical protein
MDPVQKLGVVTLERKTRRFIAELEAAEIRAYAEPLMRHHRDQLRSAVSGLEAEVRRRRMTG